MAHRQRHDGVLEMNGIVKPMPVEKASAAILPSCALRASWRCRRCRRVLSGDKLIVVTTLTALAATPAPTLTMDALICPQCQTGDKLAMAGEPH
jgi:hypothetical protein